jgi:hypothetical protein
MKTVSEFDKWINGRPLYLAPLAYSAACESWEQRQEEIDILKKKVKSLHDKIRRGSVHV